MSQAIEDVIAERKVFGVVLRLQEPEITANCYGSGCGRGIFAALFDEDLGALVPCLQEECPHLEKQSDEPLWKDEQGRDVYLRRLKQIEPAEPVPEVDTLTMDMFAEVKP